MVVARFSVWLVSLDPTQGSEIAKTRPCVVVSPDESNQYLNTVLIAPLTSTRKPYPTRVDCVFDLQSGQIALDQLRSVDKSRLIKQVGLTDEVTNRRLCSTLVTLFSY